MAAFSATSCRSATLALSTGPKRSGATEMVPRTQIFTSNTPRTNLLRVNVRRTTGPASVKRTVVASAGAESPKTAPSQSGIEIVPDTEISITKTSFGTIGLTVGVSLLSYGFGAYFTLLPGTEWSAIMLTYGFPLTLIGFALKYAELKPTECISYANAVALRSAQATPILLQVRSDVTRYRYGDEQHLEEALKRIFRYNQAGGIQRKYAPQLKCVFEEVYDGRYSLVLRFDAPNLELKDFVEREAKFTSFFGPGVTALVGEAEPKVYDVRLVVNPV